MPAAAGHPSWSPCLRGETLFVSVDAWTSQGVRLYHRLATSDWPYHAHFDRGTTTVNLDWIAIAVRWLHIMGAITAVGGTIFMRLALLPAVSQLPDDHRRKLHEAVRSRWSRVVMVAIALLLASGFYNFVLKMRSPGVTSLYQALWGIKFILAMGIFVIASALMGSSPAFARIRQNARLWLTVNLALAMVVVGLSSVLRSLKPPTPGSSDRPAAEASVP